MGRLDVKQVNEKRLEQARAEAAALRAMLGELTVFEMAAAAKQIAAVRRLVEAVEAL